MTVYSGVRDLLMYAEERTVVFVPRTLYDALTAYLKPGYKPEKPDVVQARPEFYVVEAPIFYDALSIDRYGVKMVMEAAEDAGLLEKFKMKLASLKVILWWSREKARAVHPKLLDDSYSRVVAETIDTALRKAGETARGKPVFIAVDSPTLSNIKVLTRVKTGTPGPVYILVPFQFTKTDIDLIAKLRREGIKVAFLMGLGSEEVVLVKKNGWEQKISLTQYLIENWINDLIDERIPGRWSMAKDLTWAILNKAFDREEYRLWEWPDRERNLHTLYLNGLLSSLRRRLRLMLRSYNHDEIADTVLLDAKRKLHNELPELADIMARLGVPSSIVQAVKVPLRSMDLSAYHEARYQAEMERREEQVYLEEYVN